MQIDFTPPLQNEDIAALTGAVVVVVGADAPLEEALSLLPAAAGAAAVRAAAAARFTGGAGQALDILAPGGLAAERLLLLGIGNMKDSGPNTALKLGATATARLLTSGSAHAHILLPEDTALDAAALGEGALLRSYRFDRYRTKEADDKKPTLSKITTATADSRAAARFAARAGVAAGVHFAQDLTSEPANHLYPVEFARRLRRLEELGVDVTILDEAAMQAAGMGALLGVGQGSEHESQLVVMRWNGAADDSAPGAFVGKGVTFDTGGISIKPAEGMGMMKWDMGGAAIVSGLMHALAASKAAVNIVGVVGLVENMPDGKAQRPGDVVTSLSGQTIEVLNTDAEGRLVLADALWYTKEEFKPRYMVDLATLTGAMIVALGNEYAGYFASHDALAGALDAASQESGDKLWRLPLDENYDKLINTPTADMKNIGGRAAGSITAAQFLKRFVGDVPWAHIDVAGVVWSDKDLPLASKGATGYGVRLLEQFATSAAAKTL